ncbi:hypothetical protein ABI59_01795 [Acidobacteria bacterium Mor1]|nr:hypothetical protein ABI59_01795 [Acidobacteria bacterium Mor1]
MLPDMWDEPTVALATRVTARISATLFALHLILRGLAYLRPGNFDVRRRIRGTLGLFTLAHTIHFCCVLTLARVTQGANIHARGGWVPVLVTATAFYGSLMYLYARDDLYKRPTTFGVLVILWLAFAQAYLLRIARSPLFAALSLLLIAALGVHLWSFRAGSNQGSPGSQGSVRT